MNQQAITNPSEVRTHIKYTQEEDQKFVNFLKNKNYKNLSQAFDLYSVHSDNTHQRSIDALRARYYEHIRKNYELFIMANSQGGVVNSKYIPRETTAQFKPIEIVMRQLLDLPQEERQRVLSFFI